MLTTRFGSSSRFLALACLLATAACSEVVAPPNPELVKFAVVAKNCETEIVPSPECGGGSGGGGGGGYNTSHDYGSYSAWGGYATDANVDQLQNQAYSGDPTAFEQYSRNWDNFEEVQYWPAAVGVAAIRVGRHLASTPYVRAYAAQGARWALDVAVHVGAHLLQQAVYYINATPESVPLDRFDFMFDYAIQ